VRISENKVVSHHTKNLLKEAEMEEEELLDEICNNLEELLLKIKLKRAISYFLIISQFFLKNFLNL